MEVKKPYTKKVTAAKEGCPEKDSKITRKGNNEVKSSLRMKNTSEGL